ncbi:MAG TPA: hypothetical protein VIT65_15470 [Microlunatus sp.]
MRASAVPSLSDSAVGAQASRLPRPVVWLLWLLAALAGSVVLGFLAGLARPREPDPWASIPSPDPPPPDDPANADQGSTTPPTPNPSAAEDG